MPNLRGYTNAALCDRWYVCSDDTYGCLFICLTIHTTTTRKIDHAAQKNTPIARSVHNKIYSFLAIKSHLCVLFRCLVCSAMPMNGMMQFRGGVLCHVLVQMVLTCSVFNIELMLVCKRWCRILKDYWLSSFRRIVYFYVVNHACRARCLNCMVHSFECILPHNISYGNHIIYQGHNKHAGRGALFLATDECSPLADCCDTFMEKTSFNIWTLYLLSEVGLMRRAVDVMGDLTPTQLDLVYPEFLNYQTLAWKSEEVYDWYIALAKKYEISLNRVGVYCKQRNTLLGHSIMFDVPNATQKLLDAGAVPNPECT